MSKRVKVKKISRAGAPNPDSGKYVIIAVVGVLILALGFGLGRFTSSTTTRPVEQVKATPIAEAYSQFGPKDVEGIVPVGFEKNVGGAITAATAYVGLSSRLYFAEDRIYNLAVSQFTTPEFNQVFLQRFAEARLDARRAYTQDSSAFMRELPIGYYVEEAEEEKVTIVLWSIYMKAARPDFNGVTRSVGHVIELVWHDNDWKVNDWGTGAAPTPQWQAPAASIVSVEEFLGSIQPFSGGYDYVPSF